MSKPIHSIVPFGLALFALAASACSSSGKGSQPRGGPIGGGASGGQGSIGTGGSGGLVLNVDDGGLGGNTSAGDLSVSPKDPVLDVTVQNGVVTAITGGADAQGTVDFQATSAAGPVSAAWSIDRGELGTLAVKTGQFVPNGSFSGVGTVSAAFGKSTATTTVTIHLHVVQNGGSWDPTALKPGVGGIGGVGGEAPGGPVDDATRTRLTGAAQAPASAAEFGLLYPYNATVWPRGILAPLLQWQTTHSATSVYVHLSQKNFDFQGFYAGTGLIREHVDQKAWLAATNGNAGEPLHVEVRVADATAAYGPVSEDWTVAPGVLKGTVYYNSYSTALAKPITGQVVAAAILAIKPGRSDPDLALPNAANQCLVCHNVSDDGSTLFTQTAKEPGDDYSEGAAYDLKNNGALIQSYTGGPGGPNDRKFLWAGLSKDGSYALQSSNNSADHTQEGYAEVSAIFRRDNGMAEVASGIDGVITEAVTPAFSRDEKHVAFNYWSGTSAPGGGDGHTLDMMDFACGAPASVAAGAPSCASFAFSNVKRLYTNASGYPGWPAWLPDSGGIVFQNTIKAPKNDAPLSTWHGALANLWYVNANGAPSPVALRALNGDDASGASTLPVATGVTLHGDDDQLNYEPTVNPIVSGGYAWVVFTSRRMYGNIAQGDPFVDPEKVKNITANNKKLWVAAVDLGAPAGKDPSHPAFYLPGQEIAAGNMRGFWVVDPCHADGATCATGDECCGGYCRPDGSGKLVCGGKPEQSCSREFEKCAQSGDCCPTPGVDLTCVNGYCATSVVK